MNKIVRESKSNAKDVATNTWVSRGVRLGYLVRGILYGLIGLFSLQIVIGWNQHSTDLIDVINLVAAAPFGYYLLIVLAIGLASYSLWGLIRSSLDVLGLSQAKISPLARLGFIFSSFSYAALILPVALLLMHHSSGNSQITHQVVEKLIPNTFGRVILFLIGMAGVGAGVFQFYQASQPDLLKKLFVDKRRIKRLGLFSFVTRYGIYARAAIFGLIGLYLIHSAITLNPNDAKGFGESLASLKYQPLGNLLLLVDSLGLVSFGIYSAFMTKFVEFPDSE